MMQIQIQDTTNGYRAQELGKLYPLCIYSLWQILSQCIRIDLIRKDLLTFLLQPLQICSLCTQTRKPGRETDQRPVCLNSLGKLFISAASAVRHNWSKY